MRWKALFVVQVRARVGPETVDQPPTVGVVLTPQSLVTFPVASLVVTLVWKVVGLLAPQIATSVWVPFILSFVVGAVVFLSSLDKWGPPWRQRIVEIVVAVFNCVFLFAAAVGIVS